MYAVLTPRHENVLSCPLLHHSIDILLGGVGMIFLHGPFLLELLPMSSVMIRRKLSHCLYLTGSNAHRRMVQIARGSGGS
jgi:hypothetical protein